MTQINIVQIQTALQLPVTAAFVLETLKVKPVATMKRAVYWSEADYAVICQRLIEHVTSRGEVDIVAVSSERPKKLEPSSTQADAFETDDFFS